MLVGARSMVPHGNHCARAWWDFHSDTVGQGFNRVELRSDHNHSRPLLSLILLALERVCASFICSNAFVRRIVKPMLIATIDKKGRSRTVIHDVPANEILDALAEYGIMDYMLPTSMGGLVDLDEWMVEFIAQRRAIEMEAI